MRYYYEKSEDASIKYRIERCLHPLYSTYSVYEIDETGIGIVQEHFDPIRKVIWWGAVDNEILRDIYNHPNFLPHFEKIRGRKNGGTFPIIKLRSLMWALRMKPLPREFWEK